MPFLIFFWAPVISWVMLAAAIILAIRKLTGKYSLRTSLCVYALGMLFFFSMAAAVCLTLYSTAGFELAKPVRQGDLYLVGYTKDGKCGVHGITRDYAITYDIAPDEIPEIYQPASFYETLPVTEVVFFSYINLQVLNGRLLPVAEITDTEIKASFPPRMSDTDNPPVELYYIGYISGNEKCVLFLPVWKEQLFFYHHGDITPVMVCTKHGKASRVVMSARSESVNGLTLLRKGISNVKHGLPGHKFITPFVHGLRVFYSGEDKRVMKYINPLDYVHSDLELPAKILVATPWHVFKPYNGNVDAVRAEPELIPLTEETFYELKKTYPALGIGYDVTDPFTEPYIYINYPSVKPLWPEKVERSWAERNDCVFLSPLWNG
ncbi:MAG: hypothetical protein AB1742_05910 [bacterium]